MTFWGNLGCRPLDGGRWESPLDRIRRRETACAYALSSDCTERDGAVGEEEVVKADGEGCRGSRRKREKPDSWYNDAYCGNMLPQEFISVLR